MGALKLSYNEHNISVNDSDYSFLMVVAKDGKSITPSLNSYVFHQTMPGRSYNSNAYRYGLSNGQEKDNEIFEGAFTAEYWEYDSRIGRRWNNDPVVKPWESSYACFANNPIWFSDVNGDDAVISDLLHRSGDEAEMSKELGGTGDIGQQLLGSDGWVAKDGGGFK